MARKNGTVTLTAAEWARQNGLGEKWKSIGKDKKDAIRAALKVTKRKDRVLEVAAKTDTRMAAVKAAYDKKVAFAQKQWDARTNVQTAESTLLRLKSEIEAACVAPAPAAPVPVAATAS